MHACSPAFAWLWRPRALAVAFDPVMFRFAAVRGVLLLFVSGPPCFAPALGPSLFPLELMFYVVCELPRCVAVSISARACSASPCMHAYGLAGVCAATRNTCTAFWPCCMPARACPSLVSLAPLQLYPSSPPACCSRLHLLGLSFFWRVPRGC